MHDPEPAPDASLAGAPDKRMSEMDMTESRAEQSFDYIETVFLELKYARKGPALVSTIARGLRVMKPAEFMVLLDDALDEGTLTWDDFEEVRLADIALTGRRRSDGQDVYLLAEVSATVKPPDVERAAVRARILEKLGRPVVPIVIGDAITEEAMALAHERGVWTTLDGELAAPP
jgi:hypothetical protein